MKILVLHGPNLNLLGQREPEVYGRATLDEIDAGLRKLGETQGASVETFQSNHEGELIDRIHAARGHVDGLIINAAGLTHTSVSLRDALAASELAFIEVHLSNVHAREEFRRRSLISDVAVGQVTGLGAIGYELALRGLLARLE